MMHSVSVSTRLLLAGSASVAMLALVPGQTQAAQETTGSAQSSVSTVTQKDSGRDCNKYDRKHHYYYKYCYDWK